jgi:hypothetical protein
MLWFILGLFIGGFTGIVIMALFNAGSNEDELMENMYKRI